MAKILGESARFASQEAVNRHERVVLHCMIMILICGVVEGACLAKFIPVELLPAWFRIWVFPTAAFAGLWILAKWGVGRIRKLEKERAAMRRGALGEIRVGFILSDLPKGFYVINDLTTPFGNLDHVVIGPTGVFVLDTKNCRGVIAPDGKGELLLNGKKTDKDYVRPLVRRMLNIRDKVLVLAPGPDPFYSAVLVFTAAWVDAKWGSTGAAHCIRDEQLLDYVVDKKMDKPLRSDEIKRLAQAFLSLARMDEDFSQKPNEPSGARIPEKRGSVETHGGNFTVGTS